MLIVAGCSRGTPELAQLSQALQPVNERYAALVLDKMTEVNKVPANFLTQYVIYRVEYSGQYHPVLFYVGYASNQRALLLTGMPENYSMLAQADGVKLRTAEAAASFAGLYLEVTRSTTELFYPVTEVGQVKFRPNLAQDKEQVKEAFIARYRPIIKPPQAQTVGGTYQVTAYAVREQALERHDLLVSQDGTIQDAIAVLEKDLPLVYGGN